MIRKKEDAERALSDVPMENHFWVCDGSVIKNLNELLRSIRKMKKGVYRYHANKEKNDFSNWVRNVMGDVKLAGDLSKAESKKAAIKILNQRIKWLKKKSKK
jgi:hypothetical protein